MLTGSANGPGFGFKPALLLTAAGLTAVGLAALGVLAVLRQPAALSGPYRNLAAAADLDGDGDQDVVAVDTRWESADTSFSRLTVWINQGQGAFTPAALNLPGGSAVSPGDVDGDGDADLVILDGYSVRVAFNQGGAQHGVPGDFRTLSGPFQPAAWQGHADAGGTVTLGDLDGDGRLDGFVSGCCYLSSHLPPNQTGLIPSASWTWINRLDLRGDLVPQTAALGNVDGAPIPGAALGDLDGDGDLDIFAAVGALASPATGGGDAALVLLNDGTGNFNSPPAQRLSGAASLAVALGNLDGDGDLDAVTGTAAGAQIWINQGGAQQAAAGMFARSGAALGAGRIGAVFLADFDGDGDLDALTAGAQQAWLWWNDGSAGFSRSDQVFDYSERHALAAADFNGDGRPDLFAGAYADSYSLWVNRGNGHFTQSPAP